MRASTRPAVSPLPTAGPRPSLVAIMGCVMLGPFVNILDDNVVNVSLPKIMSGLATDVLTIRWVVTCFLISTAVIMPSLGWIGRVLGNKNFYLLGLIVFTSTTTLCGMGTALWGLGASLGSVVGLPLGGYFADAVDWRAVFM